MLVEYLHKGHELMAQSWLIAGVIVLPVSILCINFAIFIIYPASTPWFNGEVEFATHGELNQSQLMFAILGMTGVGKSDFIDTLGGRNIHTGLKPKLQHSLSQVGNLNAGISQISLITH